jgi:thymidylate kinase
MEDIKTAAQLKADFLAVSFPKSSADMHMARELMCAAGGEALLIAKIERAEAIAALAEIIDASDAIMVARGDLGPAVEFIRLPEVQEELVAAARLARKPVVVATQILEYFADAGVPQRSELSGLALIAQQAPDVIMLGKETVYSPRPIECIRFARSLLAYETRRLAAGRSRLPRSLAASAGSPPVVAIEGPNGAGKTCLCSMLSERLGLPCLRGVPSGWEDSPLKLRMIRDADWLASAMYFLSGVIESSRYAAQADEKLKVMDRSLWSTLAVHYAHDPARLERLLPLVELAADRLKVPDLTIVLELSPETCRQRIARKSEEEKEMDAVGADDGFGRREREFYHWLADQGPKVVFLDVESNDLEDIYSRAVEIIRKSFSCCNC